MIAALVLVPILAGLALYGLPRRWEAAAKWLGAAVAVAMLGLTLAASGAPDESARWLQRPFTASFHLGLGHGLSFWLMLLLMLSTACGLPVVRLSRERDFVAQMLLELGAMSGVFLARDVLLFALFWDLMLVPVFLVLIEWAPSRRSTSAWRYLVYNLTGGLGLLLATAAYGIVQGSTDVLARAPASLAPISDAWALWIFAGFAFAFLIKTPVWPLHTWMPETYADLPPAMAAVISGVQSKAGLYGFMVITALLFPGPMHLASPWMFALGLIALFYGALIALVQDDAKRVVAYSSLSHLGLIVLAIFSFNPIALGGAAVYIVAHGLFSAALFLVLGEVEDREETRLLSRLGGLGARDPRLAGALTIAVLAALGLPGLCGFAGEILILTGLYQAGFLVPSALALIPVVLAAAYMLRILQRTMHGPEVADVPQRGDMTWLEVLSFAPLTAAIVLLGVQPGPLIASVQAALPQASVQAVQQLAPERARLPRVAQGIR